MSRRRAATLPAESEVDFQRAVLDAARLFGWRVAHFRPARTAHGWRTPVQADGAGFPDLILCRGDRLIAAELKRERGRLRAEQEAWLDALAVAGAETYTWRPSDWDAVIAALQHPGSRFSTTDEEVA